MKHILALLIVTLTACVALGTTPEGQIKTGADTLTATTTVATTLLRSDRITVAQAKSYGVMLKAASEALDNSNAVLLECRKKTGSTSAVKPDPCEPAVADVIKLALDSIANVKNTLNAKQ